MDKLATILETWGTMTLTALTDLATKVSSTLPHLMAALLVLLIGWALSALLGIAVRRGLHTLGVDTVAQRLRLRDRAGLKVPVSAAASNVVFWLALATFFLSSLDTLGFPALTATVDRLLAYLPTFVGGALIAVFGIALARLAGNLAGSAAEAAGFAGAHRLTFLVQGLAIGLVAIVAFEQLGVATQILVGPLTAVLAAVTLSAGFAFALGARPVITHILAGHFLKQSLPRDSFVEVQGQRGIVQRVGPIDTLLANGAERWTVPNAQLLEHVVVRSGAGTDRA